MHTFIFFNVILCNNEAICSINCLFIALLIFLIFDDEYLFTYYILLVERKNFSMFGSEISSFIFKFAFFTDIYINLHTFIFFNVILCNNEAICSINYLFIALLIFLIFDDEYLFTYYILLVQRKNFNIFGSKSLCFFFNFHFLLLVTSICILLYFLM